HGAGVVLAAACLSFAAGGVSPTLAAEAGAPDAAVSREWMRGAFAIAAALLAVVIASSGIVTFLGCRELPIERATERLSFRDFIADLRGTFGNGPFRVVLATFAVMTFGGAVNQPLLIYVVRDWLGVHADLPAVMTAYLLASMASLVFWTALARRLGKNRAFEICILWSVVVLGSFPLLGPESPRAFLFVFFAAAGFAAGGYMIPTSIAADVVDHDELATGQRREGAFFGLWTLSIKVVAAFAIAFVGISLDLLGYVPNQPQSASTLFGIRMLYGPVPALFLFLSLLIFRRFPLTRESHAEIHRELEARRTALP
ncbi:MAG: MFS transporter, partial [Candidatus Binatia bacterium]